MGNGLHRFREGDKIRGGPQMGKVAGYITPAAWGVPTASKRGTLTKKNHVP